jgi:hypothetical protein
MKVIDVFCVLLAHVTVASAGSPPLQSRVAAATYREEMRPGLHQHEGKLWANPIVRVGSLKVQVSGAGAAEHATSIMDAAQKGGGRSALTRTWSGEHVVQVRGPADAVAEAHAVALARSAEDPAAKPRIEISAARYTEKVQYGERVINGRRIVNPSVQVGTLRLAVSGANANDKVLAIRAAARRDGIGALIHSDNGRAYEVKLSGPANAVHAMQAAIANGSPL